MSTLRHGCEETSTYDRRYLATGSAPFSFIWSKNFWKSNGGGSWSFPFPDGVLRPLPLATG